MCYASCRLPWFGSGGRSLALRLGCFGRLGRSGNGTVWHLIEDFFEQGIVVKLFLGVGWLAVVIMVASFLALLFQ